MEKEEMGKSEEKEYYERFTNKTKFLKNDYYTLKRGEGYTSPPSTMPAHELKLLRAYMEGVNLKHIGQSLPHYKKSIMLLSFLKGRRNQQTKVHAHVCGEVNELLGRVSVVGRDFVALTTVTERFWIPYSVIESASVPYGISDMPNNHQQVVYDDTLRKKLLNDFSSTILKNDVLKRQFYEEALHVHLQAWTKTKITVFASGKDYKGKLINVSSGKMTLKERKELSVIDMKDIHLLKRSTPFQMFPTFVQWLKESFHSIWPKRKKNGKHN
ncbi:hypothetical protein CEQ21_03145 [Niallia circulans]|uniref:Uncharacterized protein n=1 Tax=Niallia circulans TaxID=1397 RepID=A0A553SSH2_NIACI|nr:hypothetical protein [Niallia circulans]TRZ39953.1 hypothetical protein CEQ21_03145 [Niallia circulans]